MYQVNLPEFSTNIDYRDLNDNEARLRHIPGTRFDNTVRVYKPTHIESIMRSIIGPSFDKMIAEQEVVQ